MRPAHSPTSDIEWLVGLCAEVRRVDHERLGRQREGFVVDREDDVDVFMSRTGWDAADR